MVFKNKKGSELSMNVIIIAAIAVLVLVILAMFVFKSGNNIEKSTGCFAMNGMCNPDTTHTLRYPAGDGECKDLGGKCYISLKTQS
ncbi:hypothetical protein K9M74_02520 [Candidatus Woesearchaeota archaeon]|nr:hypothetical protein [Candidatus Woesearchaeota archaeon]